jgi:hypothetical protein
VFLKLPQQVALTAISMANATKKMMDELPASAATGILVIVANSI